VKPPRICVTLALSVASITVGCGSRTQLRVEPFDSGAPAFGATGALPPETPPGSACDIDADCTTDRFCVASTRCDPASGCVLLPRSCDDGVDCTHDQCSDVERRCSHVPDDTRCPDTQLCSATRGCDAFVYAVASDGHLYEVRIPSGELVDLGTPAASLGDVALDSNGLLYATDSYVLYRTDRATSEVTTIASILPLHLYNGLGVHNGTSLLATADIPELFEVDSMSGSSRAVAPLPLGYRASGDVTALGARVFVAAAASAHPSTDTLVEVTPSTRVSVIGDFNYRCVWGLATLGGVVYGLTCEGRILRVDVGAGRATELAHVSPAFFGAAGR
jgi:hypothetical protein